MISTELIFTHPYPLGLFIIASSVLNLFLLWPIMIMMKYMEFYQNNVHFEFDIRFKMNLGTELFLLKFQYFNKNKQQMIFPFVFIKSVKKLVQF